MFFNWLLKQFIKLQILIYRRSGGKRMAALRGMPLLLLTTTGRKTGKERVTPMMYIRDGERYVVTASNAGKDKPPAWFVNLQANPRTTVEVGDATIKTMARQANPEEKAHLWAELVEKAPFFADYQKQTTRDIAMVILQPVGK